MDEKLVEIAEAKLDAVETVSWPLGMGWGAAVSLYFDSVWLFFPAIFVSAFLVRYPYAKTLKKSRERFEAYWRNRE